MLEYEISERLKHLSCRIKESSIDYQVSQEKDKSLKGLFEVKKHFVQLLKTFVKESWVDNLEEENIELADKDFILPNIYETRADLVYRVKGENIYFILLEFQSTEDKKMPYRLLSYILEIWRRYSEKEKLPVVIPCVLYTGNTKWEVKTLRSLFEVSKEIEKYIPDFEYILIDVNRYTDEELIKTTNLVGSVVYMSKSKNKNEVADKLRNIIDLISKLDPKEQRSFVKWAEVMFYRVDNVYEYFEENLQKEEKRDMALIDLIPGAIEIFRDEGREEGELIAKKSSIRKILTKKLKEEAPESVICKIESMSIAELEDIEDRIFEIESWNEI